jgi:hypothetical protein
VYENLLGDQGQRSGVSELFVSDDARGDKVRENIEFVQFSRHLFQSPCAMIINNNN